MMVLFGGTINRPNGLVVDNSEQERASTCGSFAFLHRRRRELSTGLPPALVRRRDAGKSPATP
jgi:hypothetical protein